MTIRSLHSKDASKRLKASLAFAKKYSGVKEVWPSGCFGAANAWLLLVGPSPGKAGPQEQSLPGGVNRPLNRPVAVGPEVGTIKFKSGRNRNSRWNYLTNACFGNEEQAGALTAVANLDWGNFSDQNEIETASLQAGCPAVFGIMKMSQPRVVLALSKKVWGPLTEYLSFCTVEEFVHRGIEGRIIQIPSCRFKTLLLRTQNHPSRFLSSADCVDIGSTVRWFVSRY
jgi:hypothetical protein